MTLRIENGIVFLDEHKIENCTAVDIKNINPKDLIHVAIHVQVSQVDVEHKVYGIN